MSSQHANRDALDNSGASQPTAEGASKEGHRVILDRQDYTWATWQAAMPGGPAELADTWATAFVPLHFRWDMQPYTWEQHRRHYGELAEEIWSQAEGFLFVRPWLLQELRSIDGSSLRATVTERAVTYDEWADDARKRLALSRAATTRGIHVHNHLAWLTAHVPLHFCRDNLPYTFEEVLGHYGPSASEIWWSADAYLYLPALHVPPLSARSNWAGETALPDGAPQPVLAGAAAEPPGFESSVVAASSSPATSAHAAVLQKGDAANAIHDAPPPAEDGATQPVVVAAAAGPPGLAPQLVAASSSRAPDGHAPDLQQGDTTNAANHAPPPPRDGATQPVVAGAAAEPSPWSQSPLHWPCFADSENRCPQNRRFRHANNVARPMLEWANSAPTHLFPLLVHHLCDVPSLLSELDVSTLVGTAQGNGVAAVSLEVIPRVPNHNSMERSRIDYFLYTTQGDIIRCHPGTRPRDNAKRHVMPQNTCLLRQDLLPDIGAGKALHLLPPGTVAELDANRCAPQPPGEQFLFSRWHASGVYPYDAKCYGWDTARRFLQSPCCSVANCIDLSDGEFWPWWLFLANTGRIQEVLAGGILSFEVVQLPLIRAFRVRTADETYFVFPSKGLDQNMTIRTEDQMRSHHML